MDDAASDLRAHVEGISITPRGCRRRTGCGARFDDARRMAVCPHVLLDGGDKAGVPGDHEYLVSIGAATADPNADPDALSPDLVAYLQRSESTAHRADTRYALVDVLDLATLLRTAHMQDQYDGAVLDRVEKAPLATVPCTVKLNADGGVWITPDPPAPDPRRRMGVVDMVRNLPRTDVPSGAPEPPLPLLEDFDAEGHVRGCFAPSTRFPLAPNIATCDCATKLLRVAKAWAQAYKARPAAMTFVPAPDDRVRTYGLYPASSPSEVVAFLNGHRECQPVAVFQPPPPHTAPLLVLYVQVRA